MTVLIGMFLLGLFIALGSWVISWTDHVKKDLVVNVYFCTDLTCGEEAGPKQIDAVRADLAANPDVKEFAFISKERALEIMLYVSNLEHAGDIIHLSLSDRIKAKIRGRANVPDNVVRILAPLVMEEQLLSEGLDILDRALASASAEV